MPLRLKPAAAEPLAALLLLLATCPLCAQEGPEPGRPRRADSFFGIHFDFHAAEDCTSIGANVSERDIDALLDEVKPDFIQVDCKGHPGYSSYPTRVGNPAPGFVKDPMKIYRDATRGRGVALYVHYSGVYDYYVCRNHPEWACVDAAGARSKKATSVFGPYVDRVLIPQLVELSDTYHVDGAWIDGDCWGVEPDYGEAARAAYRAASGGKPVPESPGAPGFADYLEFNRAAFRRYVARYVDAIHRHSPGFQITSNWAFSSMMPEPVSVNVDFLSGDLASQNAVNNAAFEARCMALQGLPWDLMSWGFTLDWDTPSVHSYKTAVQLEQEASEVLAMGGGFQVYFQQNRDASIDLWHVPVMKELAEFCRARRAYCHRAVPVPQIALLHSEYGYKAASPSVYGAFQGQNAPTQGILTALLDGQRCVEIVREYTLQRGLSRYPLVVIPEWAFLDKGFCGQLTRYVSGGGNLIVIGARAVGNFERDLGVTFLGPLPRHDHILVYGLQHSALVSPVQPVAPGPGTEAVGFVDSPLGPPAATIARLGRGRIAGVYVDLGDNYGRFKTAGMRDFLSDLVGRMFPDPAVEVKGSRLVHVAVDRLNGEVMVHLINAGGEHADKRVFSYDEVPPLDGLTVTIALPERPREILEQPGGRPLPFEFRDGKASTRLPRLAVYSILEVRG